MHQDNLNLFKQAIAEGLSNKIAKTESGYTGEVVCSDRHIVAMRTIVYGKAEKRKKLSTKTKILIAILVAAALILTSCGIIFRNEIKMIYDKVYVSIFSDTNDTSKEMIYEVYDLSYIPENYLLDFSTITQHEVFREYRNSEGDILTFTQSPLKNTVHGYDTENSETNEIYIGDLKIYYTVATKRDYYLWSDENYFYEIGTSERLSVEEIEKIMNGLVCE